MRAIDFVSRLIDSGGIVDKSKTLKRVLVHSVEAESFMRDLGVSSKLNADWEFLTRLRDVGRERADQWLAANFDQLGVSSTVDIEDRYL
jgi:NTE family protein